MDNEDIPPTSPATTKRPKSRKNHRIRTHHQATKKSFIEDAHTNRISTVGNNTPSKLPSLFSKSSVFPSTPETMYFRKHRSRQKDLLTTASSTKMDREGTNIISQTRLPTLSTTTNDNEHRRIFDVQRRQIYALNHLMRELEQEQFREYCKLNGIGGAIAEEIAVTTEEPKEESAV